MVAIAFAWFVGLAFYCLAWACPYPVLAFVGYVFCAWFFVGASIQAWHKSRE